MNAPPIPFEEMKEFLANDDEFGQLCDIIVPDAKGPAWAVFLDRVVPDYPHKFSLSTSEGERRQAMPADKLAIVRLGLSDEGPWPSLSIDVLGLEVCAHFFGPDSLELDAWRTKITAERYEALAELMQRMGDAMSSDVFMTPESRDDEAAMVYEVSARAFRRPLHGARTASAVRDEVMREYLDALVPLSACKPPLAGPLLRVLVSRIEAIRERFSSLTLQDALTTEDAEAMRNAWSLAATILTPAPGSGAEKYRKTYERDLIEMARMSVARFGTL